MRRRKTDEPDLFRPRCGECGKPLHRTESGYLACPDGHGKLVVDMTDPPPVLVTVLWADDTLSPDA